MRERERERGAEGEGWAGGVDGGRGREQFGGVVREGHDTFCCAVILLSKVSCSLVTAL